MEQRENWPYQEYREKPWGHEIIYTPPGLEWTGKALYVDAGKKLSLQYHDEKAETICLLSGKAILWYGKSQDAIEKIPMELQKGYTILPGDIHRYEAVEDCVFLESSTPEKGITYRLEDDYKREDEQR